MMSAPAKAVFLSYAREDAAAARRMAEALRSGGIEVWFDENELRGGDAWDANIRKQIKECALFAPVISANTQARPEGYFRLEWKLADRRTDLIGKSKAFLLPVCIDDTRDAEADVPDSFLAVQWMRLPGGETNAAFCERVRGLLDRSAGSPSTSSGQALPASESGAAQRGQIARAAPAASSSSHRPLHRRRLVAGLCAVAAIVSLVVWQPWRQAKPATPAAAQSGTALSPASAEVARLRARLIPDQWKKEDFEPWSAALDRIIAADDRNAGAWALRSIINSLQVMRTFEMSTQTLEAGRAAAQRALHLAPNSALGELALGMHYAAMISRGVDPQMARPHLNRALAALPADALTRYADLTTAWLGYEFERVERTAKAWLDAEPNADFPAHLLAAMNLGLRNATEASVWSKRAGSDRGITGIRALCAAFETNYYLRADLATARATLDLIPPGARTANRIVHARWLLAMAERRWDLALQELARTPEAVFFESGFYGPKTVLAGLAHAAAGRTDVALAQFREAERNLRELLAGDSQNEPLHALLALTLAHSGRTADARNELALVEPVVRGRPRVAYTGRVVLLLAQTHAALGNAQEAVAWLRELLSGPTSIPFTPASLRIDPRFQNIIGKPEVQALLKEFAHLDTANSTATAQAGPKSAPADKSIAVLAFTNLSDEKANEIFSDGISEELANVLGKIPGLRVAGSTSAFSFKGKGATAQEIGEKLGVAYFVEGNVKKAAGKVRITAKLISAADGLTMWTSDPFERELKDVWAVQDEIAGVIAQNLKLKLGAATRSLKTVNPEAHGLVLVGRHHWGLRTPADFDRAEAAFSQAVALDPQFAQAHAGLADVAVMRATYRMLDGEIEVADDLRRTREEAQRALALEPALAEAHAALGYALMLERKLTAAEAEFQKALALNPSYSTAHTWRGVLKFPEGRLDVALEDFEKATALDPLAPISLHMWSEALALAGRVDEALAMNSRAAAQRGEVWPPNRGNDVVLLWQKGRKEEAVAVARSVRVLWPKKPRWFADANAIWVLQQAGLQRDAADYAGQLLKELPATSSHRGLVLAALGRFEEAVPHLERASVMTDRNLFWAPMWDPFRETPRFQQLLAKIGCVEEYKVARATLVRLQRESAAVK